MNYGNSIKLTNCIEIRKPIDNKSLYMRVFYLYCTFARNGYNLILISRQRFKEAFLLTFVASFVLSDSKYLDLNRKGSDKNLCNLEIFARHPPNFDMLTTALSPGQAFNRNAYIICRIRNAVHQYHIKIVQGLS